MNTKDKGIKMEELFSDMVKRLFKVDGFHNEHAALMHAAIGLSGEVGELIEGMLLSKGRDNTVEELGDLKFYLCALSITLGNEVPESLLMEYETSGALRMPRVGKLEHAMINQELMLIMSASAAGVLDAIKKGWVYGKDIDFKVVVDYLYSLDQAIDEFIELNGLSQEEVYNHVKHKLTGEGGRYENGYTDQAAQERADKIGEWILEPSRASMGLMNKRSADKA